MSVSKSTTSTGSKRGRKRKSYKTSWDETINGLNRRPRDGRWRVIGTDIEFTEPDERLAIHKFRTLYARKERETIAIPVAGASSPAQLAEVVEVLRVRPPSDPQEAFNASMVPTPNGGTVPMRMELLPDDRTLELHREPTAADAFWPWLRRLILDKPKLVADRTGIEQIGYLADLPKPVPSPTLVEIGELYFTRAKVTDKERTQSKLFWKEFVDAVKVSTVRELSPDNVSVYHDIVIGQGNSPTYTRHRFGKVKTMLHFARKRGLSPQDMRRGLDACAVLIPPKQCAVDPHPIDKDDYHKLLGAGDDQGKAMLLLALNACMYGSEVTSVKWDQLDLEKGTLIADRGKTGVSRVAVLWPRTVEALNKLPRRIPHVFISYQGSPHNANTVRKLFDDLRAAAKVDKSVKLADVRDGAYTAAAEASGVQFEHARVLAGHRVGMSDHYVKRNPKLVAEACAAIERAYF